MEDIVADMKESEPKQRSLAKAHEAIMAKAESILVFSLQWKDLEVHFNSTRSKIEARFEDLRRCEKLLEDKVKELVRIDELVVLGKKHLERLDLLTKRRIYELDDYDDDDDKESARVRDCGKKLKMENYCEVIEVKERELGLIVGEIEERRRELEECDREMKVREERLSLIQKSIEECENRRDFSERKLDKEARDEVEKKESELEEWAVSLALKERAVNAKAKEISAREMKVKERFREIELREKRFMESKKSLEEGRQHLDMVSKKLRDKEWKLRKQSKELNRELVNRQVNVVEKSSVQHIQGQKSKEEENNGNHFVGEVIGDGKGLQLFMNEQLKRIYFMCSKTSALLRASADPAKLVLDAMQGFYRSCSDIDNDEIDFDLQLTRRSCIILLEELKRISAQISPPVREEATMLAAEWKAKMTVANENRLEIIGFLQLVTTFQLTSVYDANELCSLLAVIAHPKQATELCQGLGILNEASESSISSYVTEHATNSLDPHPNATGHAKNSPGFLHEQLIWNPSIQNKIFAALQKSSDSDPAKLMLDLMQVSFAGYLTKGEARLEETSMKSFISLLETVSGVQLQLGPQVKEDALKLAIRWKAKLRADTENSLEILGFLQFIAAYGLCSKFMIDDIANLVGMTSEGTHTVELCQKLGLAHLITDIIPNLIQREQLFSAVILTCTFKLTDNFPPAPLLHRYVDEAWNRCTQNCLTKISLDDKDKVIDSQIADLRAVIRCIKNYNLESEYQSAAAEIRMDELEKLKENWRLSAPTFISGYPQSSPSSVLPTNYGQLGPFGMSANSLQAANYGEPFVPAMKCPYK